MKKCKTMIRVTWFQGRVLLFSTLLFLICLSSAFAQTWNSSTLGQITYSGNKVGIGTTTPSNKLHVNLPASTLGFDQGIRVQTNWGSYVPGRGGGLIMQNADVETAGVFGIREENNWKGALTFYTHTSTAGNTFGSSFTEKMRINSSGNVGIGTTTPSSKLHILGTGDQTINLWSEDAKSQIHFRKNGTAHDGMIIYHTDGRMSFNLDGSNAGGVTTNELLTIKNSGNIGVGTSSPSSKLQVMGDIAIDYGNGLKVDTDWNGNGGDYFLKTGYDGNRGGDYLDFFVPGDGQHHKEIKMTIVEQGKVGIGTSSPSEKLEVNGTIRSKEVKVEASPWPDYVFEEDYDLRSLEETEAYIKANKHLPEIPSAKEMEANGVELGEMNMLLLKKIEELTLHQIEMMKIIKQQQEEIEELKKN